MISKHASECVTHTSPIIQQLHYAASKRSDEVIENLLAVGADVIAKGIKDGRTALHIAVEGYSCVLDNVGKAKEVFVPLMDYTEWLAGR